MQSQGRKLTMTHIRYYDPKHGNCVDTSSVLASAESPDQVATRRITDLKSAGKTVIDWHASDVHSSKCEACRRFVEG